MNARTALACLRDLFSRDEAFVTDRLSKWFYTYHVDLYVHGVSFDVYVEKVRAICRELRGARRVLDVGAGFGVYAALLRILGSFEVVAFDYHAEKARVARRLLGYLGLDGVSALQGDATTLPFRAGSFDAATAMASLSHIRDSQAALNEVARTLRGGARVYVFEDNNSTYPGYRRTMSAVWEGAETGSYEGGVPSEKHLAESYLSRRRAMIAGRFPELAPADLDACARATRGLYGKGIFRVVERYRSTGRLPAPRADLVCDPDSGEFEEYPLNPLLVKRMLRRAGFEPRLRCPLTGPFLGRRRARAWVASRLLTLCPALTPWACALFSVSGTLRRRGGDALPGA